MLIQDKEKRESEEEDKRVDAGRDFGEGLPSGFVPPDGGWGWVVVLSSFLIHVVVDGVTYTFGIFYTEFLKYYRENNGTTAWVVSIMVGVTFCIGPVASGLTNKYGCRAVTIVGSLLATVGLILSTFAPSVIYLFFTIGILTGAGFGLMYLPAIVCVTWYFEKRRAFATGIAVCGSGIGTFVLAPFTEFLVDAYNWKGAMLIIAGLVLNCCVFGALFRPLEEDIPQHRLPAGAEKGSEAEREKLCSNGVVPVTLVEKASTNGYEPGKGPRSVSVNARMNLDVHTDVWPATLQPPNHRIVNQLTVSHDGGLGAGFGGSVNSLCSGKSVDPGAGLTASNQQRRSSHQIRPLGRKDIFYSGSLLNIPEYRSNPNLYATSVTSIPREMGLAVPPQRQPAGDEGCCGGLFRRVANSLTCSREVTDAFREMMNVGLLKDVVFLIFAFSNFFTSIGFNVPFVYVKDRAVKMELAANDEAALLLATIGIANTVGRVVLGYLSDRSWVNRLLLYNMSLIICGLSTALSSYCLTYSTMAIYCAVFGATAGAYVSLTSVILVDLLGLEKLTNAFGLLLVFEGVACLVGSPITGWLYDWTGSYDPGFFLSGAMIAFSGVILFVIPCVQRLQQRQRSVGNADPQKISNGRVTSDGPKIEVTEV